MPEWTLTLIKIITLAVMLIGLFGLIIPIFPGLVVMWLAVLAFGFFNGFAMPGWVLFILITLLMLAGSAADNVMMGKKAHDSGASWISVAVGLLAGIVFSILWTPLGGLLAAPLALYVAEFIRRRDHDKALNATRGMMIGFGWAFVIRFGLGLVMIILWAVWAWQV